MLSYIKIHRYSFVRNKLYMFYGRRIMRFKFFIYYLI